VKILVSADETSGSGWVFLCEHVTLLAGLGVDSVVTRGRQIVTNPMEPAFGNHPELAHAFSYHPFYENQSCWVDQLDTASRDDLANWFDTQLRTDPWFIAAWQTILRSRLMKANSRSGSCSIRRSIPTARGCVIHWAPMSGSNRSRVGKIRYPGCPPGLIRVVVVVEHATGYT